MRNLLAAVLGLALGGGLLAYGAGLAGAQGLTPSSPVVSAIKGGVAPAVALAAQGLVVPPAVEDVEEMCAFLIGCPDIPLPVPRQDVGECVQHFIHGMTSPEAVKFSLPLRECGLQANSCKELRECAQRGVQPSICKDRGADKPISFCDTEGRVVNCYKGKLMQVRDCPRYGEQCAARDGSAACVLGSCPAEVPSDGTPVCSANGQKVFQCDRGKLVSLDCTAFGLACVKDPEGKPACAPPSTTACATKGTTRCEGEDAIGCVGGHEVHVQCGKSGMKCAEKPGKDTYGVCAAPAADGGSCTPDSPSKCNGSTVQYCLAGAQRSFFCKGLGFDKCLGGPGKVHCAL